MVPVKSDRKEEVEGGWPVATPPPSVSDDSERETSTNAHTAGASEEPWPGNE
jgi:hypothetical protein